MTDQTELLALGDSHARVFDRIAERNLLPHKITACAVPGATALGMVNPFSTSNARVIFTQQLDQTAAETRIVTLLGETDCGFLIWWRAAKHGVPVDEQLTLSASRYGEMLTEIKARGYKQIAALSPPLPTLTDRSQGEVAHARNEITASIEQRTELTLRYSTLLEAECVRAEVDYINLIAQELDPQTGVIRDSLRSSDPLDHHHDLDAYANLIADALEPARVTP